VGNITAVSTEILAGTNGGYVGHGAYVRKPCKMANESSDILWWSKAVFEAKALNG
jgi:hypothetical protein